MEWGCVTVIWKNGNRTVKKRRKVRLWQVENVERTNKDKFSWSRCSIWHGLQCNACVKDDSVYQQGKSYHPRVYVEECKYTDAENQQCSMLRDDNDNDDGLFEVYKEGQITFVTCLGLQN